MTNLEALKIGLKGLSKAMEILKEYRDNKVGGCSMVSNLYVQPLSHINNTIAKITSQIKDAEFYNQETKK